MAILSANMANLFDARINKVFYNNLAKQEEEYTKWCEVMSSKNQDERVSLVSELPMPAQLGEFENAPETANVEGPVRIWTHVKYGGKLTASEEVLEDDRFGVVEQTAASMGIAMNHRIETQGVYDLNSAFTVNTVGPNDAASETLCATTHATFVGAGGASQANRPATDVTMGPDSVWAGVDNFAGLKDREDNPVMAIPRLLVIPPALERTAIEMLQSIEVPYKATNETNALRTRGLKYVISHYMSSTTAWFLVTDKKPIRFYMRRPPSVKPDKNTTSDSRFWVMTCRLSHAPYDWYQIYGTDGVA